MWEVAVMVGLNIAEKYMKNKAANEAGMADNILREKRLKIAEDRAYEAYAQNINTIDSQEAINELNIDQAKALASSELKVSMAGSGIAGGIADDLDRQINLDVAKDTVASNRSIREARVGNKRTKDEQLESINDARLNMYKPVPDFSISDALGVAEAGVKAYKPRRSK